MTSLWLLAFVRSVFFAAAHHTKLEVLLSVLWDSKKWNNLWDSLMEKQGMLDGNVTVRSSPTRLRLLCKASFGFKENSQFWSDRSNLAKKNVYTHNALMQAFVQMQSESQTQWTWWMSCSAHIGAPGLANETRASGGDAMVSMEMQGQERCSFL